MHNLTPSAPAPGNEPVLGHGPGSPEKRALKDELARIAGEQIEIPLIIGGVRVTTGNLGECIMPHDKTHVLATYHKAGAAQVEQAVAAAREAKGEWEAMQPEDRAAVFLRAAELLAGKWRARSNAATMLNQSKTAYQAEIDSACELCSSIVQLLPSAVRQTFG